MTADDPATIAWAWRLRGDDDLPAAELVERGILLTINGLATGLRNSG